MTAGHCLLDESKVSGMLVRAGFLDVNADPTESQVIQINRAETVRHPMYTPRSQQGLPFLRHDIALLWLNRSLTFNSL